MGELTLDGIVKAGLCTGCGACAAVLPPGRVRMAMSSDGFLRPVAARGLSELDEQAVRAVCPGIGLSHPSPAPRDSAATIPYHPVWGPIGGLFAGHAADPEIRRRSSSGGVLSALLIHLLESRQVDFVVHVRAAADDPLRNDAVISTTRDEVALGAGSRYAPAAPVEILPVALARPGRFAFVGKPCDVAAVRKLMQRDHGLAARIPYLLSFMCAGTPSLEGTHEVLRHLNMSREELVSFRYRGDGWPGFTSAQGKDGRVATMDYNTSWGTILNRYLQPRCKLCADGIGEFADVVCADAWYGKDGYPDFSERDGRSLVVARTAVGLALCGAASAAVSLESLSESDLRVIQPYQWQRKSAMQSRLLALRLLGRKVPNYRGMGLGEASLGLGLGRRMREFVGTLVRSLKGRL